MTFQTLTPTPDVPDGAGLDITALLAAPTNVNLQFSNTGRERLYVLATASSITVQVDVGSTVLGQAVPAFTAVTLTTNHLYQFGRFHSVLDIPGTGLVQVVLSTITGITVALIQDTGVY